MNFKKLFTGLALMFGIVGLIAGVNAYNGQPDSDNGGDGPTTLAVSWSGDQLVAIASSDAKLLEIDLSVTIEGKKHSLDANLSTVSESKTLLTGDGGFEFTGSFNYDDSDDTSTRTITFTGNDEELTPGIIAAIKSSTINFALQGDRDNRGDSKHYLLGSMYNTRDCSRLTGSWSTINTDSNACNPHFVLSGFEDASVTVGDSATFKGEIDKISGADIVWHSAGHNPAIYFAKLSITKNGDTVLDFGKVTTSNEGDSIDLPIDQRFPLFDVTHNNYDSIPQDITVTPHSAGTYEFMFEIRGFEGTGVNNWTLPLTNTGLDLSSGSAVHTRVEAQDTKNQVGNDREYNFALTVKNKSSGGGGGGGGRSNNPSDTPADTDTDTSDDDTDTDTDTDSRTPAQEQSDAYEFAYEYGITTMGSLAAARVADPVTRAEFAKMISVFAEQFTDASLDTDASCVFADLDAVNDELAGFIQKACQYGIMGQNMGDNFRPNDVISRAEVATTISRLLGLASDGDESYYVPHLQAMMDAGYITQNTPDLAELRGYMFIMLQRIAETE